MSIDKNRCLGLHLEPRYLTLPCLDLFYKHTRSEGLLWEMNVFLYAPLIDTKWLDDPRDKEQAIAAFRYSRLVAATESFRKVVVGDELFPGPGVKTDEQILAYLKQTASTLFHASCTCKLGLKKDINAVVDSDAKVIGVNKLRVVDASAFALLPPGQPQATVYMLAEKIAERILETACARDLPVCKDGITTQQSNWWSLLQTQLGWESDTYAAWRAFTYCRLGALELSVSKTEKKASLHCKAMLK